MNTHHHAKVALLALCAALSVIVLAAGVNQPGVGPTGSRYATDAYPGFDQTDKALKPEKKTPRWFAFINGPKMSDAASQYTWAQELAAGQSWARARRAYDALVREWPTSPEAPKAQLAMADILLNHELEYEDAFAAYRYLLDFYSIQCAYDKVVATMYQVANLMRQEGKTVMFFRFKNSTDVRRAFEALVVRAPGASFVPDAMLTIAEIRSEEEKDPEAAIAVLENLRSLHPGTPQALTALRRESDLRVGMLRAHGYNRARVADTVAFIRGALRSPSLPEDVRAELQEDLEEAESFAADDDWKSARFYDSRTRTTRSAIAAYERYLAKHPNGEHAEEARIRIAALKAAASGSDGQTDKEAK